MATKARPEVVKELSETALAAMEDADIEDLTVNEVISACYTMTRNITETVMQNCEAVELEPNRDKIITAIAELYALVQPPPGKLN